MTKKNLMAGHDSIESAAAANASVDATTMNNVENASNEESSIGTTPKDGDNCMACIGYNCPFRSKKNDSCLGGLVLNLLEVGEISAVALSKMLINECEVAKQWFGERLIDVSNKHPDEIPDVLKLLKEGKFEAAFDWIRRAADLSPVEAKELMKHLKK